MKKLLFTLLTSCCLLGCSQPKADSDCPVLSVDLSHSTLQYEDVFSHAEVIPLETTDNSLVVYPVEAIEHKGHLYLYDIHTVKAFVFDEKGKFVCQVGREGQGPGEYSWLASISIDKKNDVLHLVEPMARLHHFALDGKLIETKKYADGNDYQCIHHLGDYLVSWSHPESSGTDCIRILDPQTLEVVNTFDRGPLLLQSRGFYSYNDELFYTKVFNDYHVYKVTKDSLALAYRWNFGKDNIDMNALGFTYEDDNYQAERKQFQRNLSGGTVPFIQVSPNENDRFYYTCLRHSYKYDKNIFYRKSDGKYLIFGESSWKMPTNALVLTNDHVILLLKPDNYENFKPFLSEAERQKIEALTEDDNPCLLKLYFKK